MKVVFIAAKLLLIVAVPLLIIITSIRLLVNPLYPQFEYNTPYFPADPYGFTKADRLNYSGISIDYLLNNSDITFFNQYKLADGSPIYNERELSHMQDVKTLIQNAFLAWGIIGIALVLAGVISWQTKQLRPYFTALSTGGWTTLVIIGLILVGAWVLVRASSNKPELVVVVESMTSDDDMRALFRDEIKPRLARFPEVGNYNQEI